LRGLFLGFRQLSGAGPESQYLVGRAAGWNTAERDDNAIRARSIPKNRASWLRCCRVGRTGFRHRDTNGHKHEVVKECVMSRRFPPAACLVLSCGLVAVGPAPAEATGVGVHLRAHTQNIPRAVAGMHNPHIGVGAGAQAPSRLTPNTRSIQLDGAGESAATRSLK
jgi:hypothetical protein